MMHICRGDGDGTALYFGEHPGAPFVSVGFRGFCGWQSHPRWMPGGWEFFSPHLGVGRVFTDRSRFWWGRVIVPAGVVHLWRKRKRAYREPMGEAPVQHG